MCGCGTWCLVNQCARGYTGIGNSWLVFSIPIIHIAPIQFGGFLWFDRTFLCCVVHRTSYPDSRSDAVSQSTSFVTSSVTLCDFVNYNDTDDATHGESIECLPDCGLQGHYHSYSSCVTRLEMIGD